LAPLIGSARIDAGVRASFGPNVTQMPSDFIARRVGLWTRPTVVVTLSQERTTFNQALAEMQPRYADIRKPVVIICGEEDHNAPDALRLARKIPRARGIALRDTGHYVQYAHPEVVVTAVDLLASEAQKRAPTSDR